MTTQPIQPIQPVQPQQVGPFETRLTEWSGQAQKYSDLAKVSQAKLQDIYKRMEESAQAVQPKPLVKLPDWLSWIKQMPSVGDVVSRMAQPVAIQQFKPEITQLTNEIEKADFYQRLYSEVPLAIAGGKAVTADEVLTKLTPPPNTSTEELEELTKTINDMVSVIRTGRAAPPEMAAEAELPEFPELVPPKPRPVPLGIQRITANAIREALMAPRIPEPVMSDAEYRQFLYDSGQVEKLGDAVSLEQQADELIKSWQDRNSQIAAFREYGAKLPDYKLKDLLVTMFIQPGLALAEFGAKYFEHVSQPLSGLVYKMMIPDIEAEYQRLRKSESTWMAASHAWQAWKAPGANNAAPDWILKYMIMEAIFDPLTYLGWGIFTIITRPLGAFGRFVGAAERGFMEVLDMPIDALKAINNAKWTPELIKQLHLEGRIARLSGVKAGEYILPKTIGQLALMEQNRAGQVFKQALELWSIDKGKPKTFYQFSKKDLTDFINDALKYYSKHPNSEQPLALAGKELLKHKPLDADVVKNWAAQLKTKLAPEEITNQTLLNVNDLLEDTLSNILKPREAAGKLLQILDGASDEPTFKLAQKLLENRVSRITTEAKAIANAPTSAKAIQFLMRRNYRISVSIQNSVMALERAKMGRIHGVIQDTGVDVQRVWANTIDRLVVRKFAEAYLTFGMYGPMNVVEDYIRSALGGVFPGRKSAEYFAAKWAGISYDPDLTRSIGSRKFSFTEMMGPRDESVSSNWVTMLGTLELSLPTFVATGGKVTPERFATALTEALVHKPGMFGMDIRRNFVDVKATQILAEAGGDKVLKLMELVKSFNGTSNKKLNKQIEQWIAGSVLSGNPDMTREAVEVFTRKAIIQSEIEHILTRHPNMPSFVRQNLIDAYKDGRMFQEVVVGPARDAKGKFMKAVGSIEQVAKESDDMLSNYFLKSPELATRQMEDLATLLTELEVRDPLEMSQLIWSLNKVSEIYGAMPKQILANASVMSRGLPFEQRRALIEKALDDVNSFIEKGGSGMERIMAKIKADQPKINTPEYVAQSDRLFDLQTAKRLRLVELTQEFNLWRRAHFADVDTVRWKSDMSYRDEIYEEFYLNLDSHIHKVNLAATEYDGLIDNAIEVLDGVAGIPKQARPAVVVADRALAPNDVARLLGARGDDLSRAILDSLTIQNDKDMFVAYVVGKVRQGDIGFTKESVGAVYDQLVHGLGVKPEAMTWLTTQRMELEAVRREMHELYNAKLLPKNEMDAIAKYANETANSLEQTVFEPRVVKAKVPDYDIGLGERIVTPEQIELFKSTYDDVVKQKMKQGMPKEKAEEFANSAYGKFEELKARPVVQTHEYLDKIRTELIEASELVPAPRMSRVKGVGELKLTLKDAIDEWFLTSDNEALQMIGRTASQAPEYLAKVRGILRKKYPSGYIRIYRGSGKAKSLALAREYTNVTSSRRTALDFENTWQSPGAWDKATGKFITREGAPAIDNVLIKVSDVVSIGAVEESELIIPVKILQQRIDNPLKPPVEILPSQLKPEYKDYQQLRQASVDEASKWYYKEYVDYTHANYFDAMMKAIYPYWSYESQRWLYLPRSFVRHPVVATELSRYNDNSDYGYVQIPHTSVAINPFRGTVFGTMTTRLMRRDYPEYYDNLPFAGNFIEFNDFLSRYGFYPGAHIGIPLALMGGREAQFGEVLPATYKTLLDTMIALFPESEAVKAISQSLFNDRFRDYLTIREVDKRGANGSLIQAKMKNREKLTDEEQDVWDSSRSEIAWYSAGFEQFGLFKLQPEEITTMRENTAKAIHEMVGVTPDEQKQLRDRGIRLWDVVGGMSPAEQDVLKALDYYTYTNISLLPGKQQDVLTKLELAWDDVRRYTESISTEKLSLQRQFLAGAIGPQDYSGNLVSLYIKQREYIDNKMAENPLMDIDTRKDYYKEFNIPQPVMHPMRELLNLYFSIELKDTKDEETGERIKDWDRFWSERQAIEDAIPDNLRQEWSDYLSRNSTRIEELRREVGTKYFKKYNELWETILTRYTEEEQSLIKEYLYLEKTGQKLDRQSEIQQMVTAGGNKLVSEFRSNVSSARKALRYANPSLDAWLNYWGRTTSFMTPQAEQVYRQLLRDTGRQA